MFESVDARTHGHTDGRRLESHGELKMEELEWSQDFTNYNPMGAICCHGYQSSDPIWPKT